MKEKISKKEMMENFVASLDLPKLFKAELSNHLKKKEVDKIMSYLNSTTFFEDPAAGNYHSNFKGGLAYHSWLVYCELVELVKIYDVKKEIEPYDAMVAGLFHDMEKLGGYREVMKSKKVDGTWTTQLAYEGVRPEIGKGFLSVVRIAQDLGLPMTQQVREAIYVHHGAYGVGSEYSMQDLNDAYSRSHLPLLLHTADMMACKIREVIV